MDLQATLWCSAGWWMFGKWVCDWWSVIIIIGSFHVWSFHLLLLLCFGAVSCVSYATHAPTWLSLVCQTTFWSSINLHHAWRSSSSTQQWMAKKLWLSLKMFHYTPPQSRWYGSMCLFYSVFHTLFKVLKTRLFAFSVIPHGLKKWCLILSLISICINHS